MKLDLRSGPKTFKQTVERLHSAAFGPSPSLYRQMSLCGWRPLIDHRMHDGCCNHRFPNPRQAGSIENPAGIAVHETDEGITIEVALSSVKEESLHLAITGKRVIIRGEMVFAGQGEDAMTVGYKNRSQFQRIIQLPPTVNVGGFRAQLVNDIVRINFTKRH